jgi:integrase/recombinase XerD
MTGVRDMPHRGPNNEEPAAELSPEDLDALPKVAKGKTFAARRDTAIMSLFKDSGVRLAELAGLTLADIDLKRRSAVVTGKGGKMRTVRFTRPTASALGQYLKERAKQRRAPEPDLWLSVTGKGGMTGDGIYQLIKRRGEQAGVKVHPHQFRHTFSHNWLDNGGEEWDLGELNGWESPQMLRSTPGAPRPAVPATPTTV